MSDLFLHIPHIGVEEKEGVNAVLDAGMLTDGYYLHEFEYSLYKMLNNTPVVVCSSGTAALHLGLNALDIGPGDEVIVPDVSFISTINAVLYTGATPVLCDIGDPFYELSIDPEKVIPLITPKTRAVMVAHLFGGYGDIEKLLDIASAYGIHVIEDAAQSVGCSIHGKGIGTIGKFGIYSFNGNKIVTAAGGGALISSDQGLIDRVRNSLNQAKDYQNPFLHIEKGFNYRLSNIHAAIGYAQLKKLNGFIEKKRLIHEVYKKELNLISYRPKSNYWLNVCRLKKKEAEKVYKVLMEEGIQNRPIYFPFHFMRYLKKYKVGDYPISERLYKSLLCLPSDLSLDKKMINRIISVIKNLEIVND